MIKQYRKKQIFIKAIQYLTENTLDIYRLLSRNENATYEDIWTSGDNFLIDFCNGTGVLGDLLIKSGSGHIRCRPGDWITEDSKGCIYPYDNDTFKKLFDEWEFGSFEGNTSVRSLELIANYHEAIVNGEQKLIDKTADELTKHLSILEKRIKRLENHIMKIDSTIIETGEK